VLPAILAKILGLKLVLVELNSTFGKVSRVLSPLCTAVLTSWPKTSGSTAILSNKLRIQPPVRTICIKQKKDNSVRITVVGGSQGARQLNAAIPKVIRNISPAANVKIFHFTGFNDSEMVKKAYGSLKNVEVISFSNDLTKYLSESDIVISRSGANILFECAYLGKVLFLVPISKSSLQHQFYNSHILSKNGCAILLDEKRLVSRHTEELLLEYINNGKRREMMGKRIHNFFYSGGSDLTSIVRRFYD
jgi:UDP-N-acetylglucosamine--N-acetylmuramyl-(pentapeptide) pyrophosphoryl-undecaprenol N-acetylglucosamine transferase